MQQTDYIDKLKYIVNNTLLCYSIYDQLLMITGSNTTSKHRDLNLKLLDELNKPEPDMNRINSLVNKIQVLHPGPKINLKPVSKIDLGNKVTQ